MATGTGDGERPAEVLHPLSAGERGLVARGAGPLQGLEDGQTAVTAEHPRDLFSLVEMAVLEASAMEWHGHQRPVSVECRSEPGIAEGLGSKSPEVVGEVEFAAVFQAVNHV